MTVYQRNGGLECYCENIGGCITELNGSEECKKRGKRRLRLVQVTTNAVFCLVCASVAFQCAALKLTM